MDCRRATSVLLLAFFGCVSSPAFAQVNLKTGYNISMISTPGVNELIDAFNETQTYKSSFSNLSWMHGFEMGLRFKGGIHALELTYQGGYQILKAEENVAGTDYTDRLRFSIHSGAIGYQVGDGAFGVGTDVQYQWYKSKYEDESANSSWKVNQEMVAFKFYLMFVLQGANNIDFAIQPYMVLPTKYYDPEPLADILGIEENFQQDKFIRYGITLLFYNGQKY
jgi:hypothetical protein